jgi:hypothetical protein
VPDGRRPVLVIRPQGMLRLELLPPPGRAEFSRGRIEIVLVDREVDHVVSTHAFSLPFEIDELPAGEYNAYVLDRGWDAYAEGSTRVRVGEAERLRLASQSARWVRGRLLETSGEPSAGTALRLEHPGWPDALEDVWSTVSAADGSFELPLGSATLATLEILEQGVVRETLSVSAGDGQAIQRR